MSLRLIPIAFIAYGTTSTQLRKLLVDTPGIADILAKHWLDEVTYMKQIEMTGIEPRFTSGLVMLPLGEDDTYPSTVRTSMVQATGEDGDTVARIAVEHLLHSLTDEVDRDTDTFNSSTPLPHEFSLTRHIFPS
jgi:hypothetical protein